MKTLFNILIASLLSVAAMSQADDQQQQPEKVEKSDKSDKSEFLRNLQQYFPSVKPDSVRPSPVKGLYEIIIGPNVYYISQDARFLMSTNIIDLQNRANLTRPVKQKARNDAFARIGEENMIIFSPEKPEFTITAFTDIDCVYCRKMHSEVKQYNELGIAIRYMFFPAAGMGSESYKKAVSVWCSKDRKKALTDAKAGVAITFKSCDNPISEHMQLVQKLELRGTPALLLPPGELVESYIPPAQLSKLLRSWRSR